MVEGSRADGRRLDNTAGSWSARERKGQSLSCQRTGPPRACVHGVECACTFLSSPGCRKKACCRYVDAYAAALPPRNNTANAQEQIPAALLRGMRKHFFDFFRTLELSLYGPQRIKGGCSAPLQRTAAAAAGCRARCPPASHPLAAAPAAKHAAVGQTFPPPDPTVFLVAG